MATITAIRNIRGEMNVPPGTQVEVFLHSPEAGAMEALNRHRQSIQILGRVQELHCNAAAGPPVAAAKAVVDAVDIFMPLAGIIDFAEEAKRLDRELEKLGKEVTQAQRKMSNEDFLAKAPAEVVAKEQAKLQAQTDKLHKLKTHRERIQEVDGVKILRGRAGGFHKWSPALPQTPSQPPHKVFVKKSMTLDSSCIGSLRNVSIRRCNFLFGHVSSRDGTISKRDEFRLRGGLSVILMSLRAGAPYADRIEENGKILIYEGHDIPSFKDGPKPKYSRSTRRKSWRRIDTEWTFLRSRS